MKKGLISKAMCCALSAVMLVGSGIPVLAENSSDKSTGNAIGLNEKAQKTYSAYISEIGDPAYGQDTSFKVQGDKEYKINITPERSISVNINIPKSGAYAIRLRYATFEGMTDPMAIALLIDGAELYDELGEISLPRYFADGKENRSDNVGNELSKEIIQQYGVYDYTLQNKSNTAELLVNLKSGKHTFTVSAENDSFALLEITLKKPQSSVSYESYSKSHGNAEKQDGFKCQEAEITYIKNSPQLIQLSDNTSADVSPYNHKTDKINYIGGGNWSQPGDEITWEIDVPESGLYKLGFNYRQNHTLNTAFYRQLKIDGQIPFAEAAGLEFPYAMKWDFITVGDKEGNPYWFYLEKGKHTLSLAVTLGAVAEASDKLEQLVYGIGELYRQMVMITGDVPDTNRDYSLFERVSGLEEGLEEYKASLEEVSRDLAKVFGSSSASSITTVNSMINVISLILDNKHTAHQYINRYYDSYASLSSMRMELTKMPLDIDRIYFGDNFEDPKASFLDRTLFSIQRFFHSFADAYADAPNSKESDKEITIWINWGRDQAKVLKYLIQSDFSTKTNINVDIKLTNASLTHAALSGSGPDLQLHLSRSEPVNLAMRDAVYDLTQFKDFPDVAKLFKPTAMDCYRFENGVYALPDQQTFFMMFIREDIFKEMGIAVPKTWDEFIDTSVLLLRRNMQVGLPYTQIAEMTQVNAGVGALSINGDFEAGTLKGFTASVNKSNGIKVVDTAQNTGDTALTSKAAYIAASAGSALQAKIKLPANKYTWEFDLTVNKTSGGWAPIFGVSTKLGSDGNGYVDGGQIAMNVTSTTNQGNITKAGTAGYYFDYGTGRKQHKITATFELSAETELYFYIRSSDKCYMYVDNMKLYIPSQTELINGDFETGDLEGFDATVNTSDLVKVVDTAQNSGDTALTSKAAYIAMGDNDALQAEIKLPKGRYAWAFDLTVNKTGGGWAPIFGVSTKLGNNGCGYTDGGQIPMEVISTTNQNDLHLTSTSAGYYFEYGTGRKQHKITATFELSEETTLYFYIRSSSKCYMYVDNMSLTASVQTKVINGDFEKGTLEGFLASVNTGNLIKVVDTAQNTGDTALTSKAAYIAKGADNALQAKIKLPKGKYVWSFDLTVNKTSGGWAPIFGVSTKLGSDGSGYVDGGQIAMNVTSTTNQGNITKAGTAGYYFDYGTGRKQHKITATFELDAEKELYFYIRSSDKCYMYVDNMTLGNPIQTELINGDFETGDLEGFAATVDAGNLIKVVDAAQNLDDTELTSKAAYIAQAGGSALQTKITLPAGSYVWEFDLDINKSVANWAPIFGIATQVNNAGLAYGTGSQIDMDAVSSTNSGSLKLYDNNGKQGYYFDYGVGRWKHKITASFDLSTETELYFFINSSDNCYTYVDNMRLYTFTEKQLQNGDFELGDLTGYLNKGKAWNKVEVHTAAQAQAKGATIDGSYAGYIPKNKSGNAAASFLTQEMSLRAGTYTLSFDVDIKSGSKIDNFYFDVYKTLNSEGTYAYGTQSSATTQAVAFDSKNKEKATGYVSAKQDRWIVSSVKNGVASYHIELKFVLTTNSTVYFTAGFPKGSNNSEAYIDNIKTTKGWTHAEPQRKTDYGNEYIVYEIDFESEFQQPVDGHGYSTVHFSRDTTRAHSGKTSVIWNPFHTDGWQYLFYTDANGYALKDIRLEPGESYRFSYWYYSKGFNTAVGYQPNGQSITQLEVREPGKWHKFEYVFTAATDADTVNQLIRVVACYNGLGYSDRRTWIDDIKLEKLKASVLEYNEGTGKYPEEFFNLVDNGDFENPLKNTAWDKAKFNITRIDDKANADSGRYYANFKGSDTMLIPISVWKGYQYTFAYSYRADRKNNLKIGIVDDKGNELPAGEGIKQKGLLSPNTADGEWHRDGITFLTPSSGKIYLKIVGTDLDIDLDMISIFRARTGYEENPNYYGFTLGDDDLSDGDATDLGAIGGTDVDDLDDIGAIDDIGEQSGNAGEASGVKTTRTIIEYNWLAIILVIAGSVLLAAGAVIAIIIIIKKRKRKGVSL